MRSKPQRGEEERDARGLRHRRLARGGEPARGARNRARAIASLARRETNRKRASEVTLGGEHGDGGEGELDTHPREFPRHESGRMRGVEEPVFGAKSVVVERALSRMSADPRRDVARSPTGYRSRAK